MRKYDGSLFAMAGSDPIDVDPHPDFSNVQIMNRVNALTHQLNALQRMMEGMSKQDIVDQRGIRYEVVGLRHGGIESSGLPLSPIFTVKEDRLIASISPHGFLAPDTKDIFKPVIPYLGGKKITDSPTPEVPLSNGEYFMVLRTAPGRGYIEFIKDTPPNRDKDLYLVDWMVLCKFVVDGLEVRDLESYVTSPQLNLRTPPGFFPYTWMEDGEQWKVSVTKGYVWDYRQGESAAQGASYEGDISAGDKLYLQVKTDSDDVVSSLSITKNKGEAIISLPELEDQPARSGVYFLELCEFVEVDTHGEQFSLQPKIKFSGNQIWEQMSFKNIGEGEGLVLSRYTEKPRKLEVKSLKNIGAGKPIIKPPKEGETLDYIQVRTIKERDEDPQVKVELKKPETDEELTIRGNDCDSQLVFIDCDGKELGSIKFVDGLNTTKDTLTIKVGKCGSSSSNDSIP